MKKKSESKAWLITFSDLVTLMLVFFVMLFSMSSVDKEKWDRVVAPISKKDNVIKKTITANPNVVFNAPENKEKLPSYALDYLYNVLAYKIDNMPSFQNVELEQKKGKLILSIPSDLLFKSNSTELFFEGKKAMSDFVQILLALKNQIHIIAYADPRPIIRGPYHSNWELSLARGVAVAELFKKMGYPREFVVFAGGEAAYQKLSIRLPEAERYKLARSVDIVIFDEGSFDNGSYF